MQNIYLAIPMAPLLGAIVAGLFGWKIGRTASHVFAISGVAIAFLLSLVVFNHIVIDGAEPFNGTVYTWMVSNGINFQVGFLIDKLTAVMLIVVTFVSLMVHIYTIGYMHDDPGYQRFFSYIALFTFSMLMLVMSNNFLQLFFGWEAVGLVSYLLIGFWFKKPTAVYANLKAFLVNRVGDFGFLLGIAAVLTYTGSLDYAEVFKLAPGLSGQTIEIFSGYAWSVTTVICILLFIGAMGKSAQVPLHVWLPDSMEGPTPISALIHAATMVTAGIFMVARMSPLFELSETALSFVLVIGAITALFMGFLGLVQNDIKRVIAYSTLSQLGYMTVALGVSAYATGVFHLMTHAFFKALLFLGAGSVIIAMHHEQDMRKMGGLRKYMPITWITSLIGSLALIGTPGFAGFYSKDAIITAVKHSSLPGSGFAYIAVLTGVFITALYSFRMYFMVFHGKGRMDDYTREHLHECPPVVTWPLIALAIPSVVIGAIYVDQMAFGGFFGSAISVSAAHQIPEEVAHHFHSWWGLIVHSLSDFPVYLAGAGVLTAWFLYIKRPDIPGVLQNKFAFIYKILDNKYFADRFNEIVFAGGSRLIGRIFWQAGDVKLIDGLIINGSARSIGWFSSILRQIQTGYLYHYAFAMIIGLLSLLTWFVFGKGS
ncbi:MAG TPA: NADH-quinone oxidoreductase subunit L [Gammaproteobacteria bacterium]|nr:NADH-quinone oxidoreductase subunit L [Gammaproteobacteria bacterium]